MHLNLVKKKKKKNFLVYKEIQKGSGAKSYMTNGLLIYCFSVVGDSAKKYKLAIFRPKPSKLIIFGPSS